MWDDKVHNLPCGHLRYSLGRGGEGGIIVIVFPFHSLVGAYSFPPGKLTPNFSPSLLHPGLFLCKFVPRVGIVIVSLKLSLQKVNFGNLKLFLYSFFSKGVRGYFCSKEKEKIKYRTVEEQFNCKYFCCACFTVWSQ